MTSLKFQYDDLMNPVIAALKSLGGSGTNEEIINCVAEIANIPIEQLELLHNPDKGGMTELEYRLMWTRTYLKLYGIIDNSTRGIWALTATGSEIENVDEKDVVHSVRELMKKNKHKQTKDTEEPDEEVQWQDELLGVLLEMSPDGFERLIQRILREAGFTQVEVTGRNGDGGIDGHGIMRLGGLISFNVIFQAKRWKGAVGASIVRDFRGAMVGRADKGLLITTGTFTKDAKGEATRDGAPAIDLVDGDQLVEKLKDLSLGVDTKRITVEEVTVDKNWYQTI
jgi:restriction system protein